MSQPTTRRLAVFTGKYAGASTVEHIEAIADAFPRWEVTVVQEDPPRRWRPYLRRKLGRLAREPVSCAAEACAALAGRLRRPPRRPAGGPRLAGSPARIDRPNVAYRRFPSLRGKGAVAFVRDLGPWLGLSLSAPILRPSLFKIPELGTINLHKSLLPDYRGMPPGFWELHDGAGRTGVSVHWVDEGLDTGGVLEQAAMPVPPYATPAGLAAGLDLLGTRALLAALRRLDGGDRASVPQGESTIPTRSRPPWALARAVGRACRRRREGGLRLARLAKAPVFFAYVYGWAALRNAARGLRGRCHTAVLLYHRVSDAHLDTVTVGVEQFERQVRALARRYDILDLPTFLAERGRPRRRPAVVLTFDDGYEDNHLAALLLRRVGVPCTFFLSTRIVGGDRAFPHDLERLGRRVPALGWDQVREMAGWGFRFGNHTAHHANLAEVGPERALAEVAAAGEDLRRELGGEALADCLAYPYGLAGDISPEVRGRLPELGIDYCLSAYGGTNPPDFDPMDVRRQGVDHGFSVLSLLSAVEGWRRASRPAPAAARRRSPAGAREAIPAGGPEEAPR